MSRTTLGVWAIVLAAGAFAILSIYFHARRQETSLSRPERAVRGVIVAAWFVTAVVTPIFGHDGPQPVLTTIVASVIVACVGVGLADFLD